MASELRARQRAYWGDFNRTVDFSLQGERRRRVLFLPVPYEKVGIDARRHPLMVKKAEVSQAFVWYLFLLLYGGRRGFEGSVDEFGVGWRVSFQRGPPGGDEEGLGGLLREMFCVICGVLVVSYSLFAPVGSRAEEPKPITKTAEVKVWVKDWNGNKVENATIDVRKGE